MEAQTKMAKTLKTTILLRNDTATKWAEVKPILGKGEIGIEIDTNKIKIGDGATSWDQLSYFKGDLTDYYTKEEVAKLVKDAVDGVDLSNYYNKSEIETFLAAKANASDVYTKTEVDNAIAAVTIDEIDADKVTFATDLTFTSTFGKYKPDASGSVKIPTATDNMTLQGLLLSAFSTPKDPTVDTPTVTLTATGNSEKEVGYTFSMPTATLTVTDIGSYTYGPSDTGVRFPVGGLTITQTTTNNGSTAVKTVSNTDVKTKGNTISLTADDNISSKEEGATDLEKAKGYTYGDTAVTYYFKASSKYTPNLTVIPVNNLGTEKPALAIGYGVKTADDGTIALTVSGTPKSTTFTGCRKMFWGTMSSKPDTLTSDQVRGLNGLVDTSGSYGTKNANGIKVATGERSLSIGTGAMRVVVAVPKGRTLSKVLDANDSNANIVGSFSSMEVEVEGYNGYKATTYTVYYIDYANATTVTNTYKVTIA